jgi:hypothetical protein
MTTDQPQLPTLSPILHPAIETLPTLVPHVAPIELSPENAAIVAGQAMATGRSPAETVNDIISLYGTAMRMTPIIEPPATDRDYIDEWMPPGDDPGWTPSTTA